MTGLLQPGFPIRTPPDQSLLGGSPENFVAYHVLHRLLAPRHPPDALKRFQLLLLSHPIQLSKNLATLVCVAHRLLHLVEVNGIEPMASCVQGRRSPS